MANLNDIFNWFSIGRTPTAEQFKQSWSSFWHKSEKVSMSAIFGLNDVLNNTASKEDLENVAAGLVPMGDALNIADLNTKPKRNNDSYFVLDQLDENGNPYIFRYDAELEQWINTKQIVYKNAPTKEYIRDNYNIIIKPENSINIEMKPYLKDGSFTQIGVWEALSTRLSLVDYPVLEGDIFKLYNIADTASNKTVIFYNSANEIINRIEGSQSVPRYQDFTNVIIEVPTDAVKMSITLVSQLGDKSKADSIQLFRLKEKPENALKTQIDTINGFPLTVKETPDVVKGYIKDTQFRVQLEWLPFGLTSGGGINTNTDQWHLEYFAVANGDTIASSDGSMIYRINFYDKDKKPIGQYQQETDTYTIDNEDVKFVRLSTRNRDNKPTFFIYRVFPDVYKSIAELWENVNEPIEQKEYVSSVSVGGLQLPMTIDGNVNLTNATPTQAGAMSANDKSKLDNITAWSGTINIEGSGVTKNAAAFGFLPTNTAEQNATAIQNALNGGGTILVDIKGTYNLCNTIYLDSDTKLIFGAGVYVKKQRNLEGKPAKYVFINRGAFTREYNENIQIIGLTLICNGLDGGSDIEGIAGLRGYVALFYAKDIIIRDFVCLDVLSNSYCIHICTFENLLIENIKVFGRKDAVHLGKGSKFVIRHGLFKTYDDPIALNAHDYQSGQPQLGWIENGIIEDCYDLADTDTTGYFARILAGSWVDWFAGMEVQQGDTVVSNNRLYRVNMSPDGTKYISNSQPTHAQGSEVLDGIKWTMVQDDDTTYNAGCRNIHFKNIYLQKKRGTAFSIHFDKDNYSRSYYPNSVAPIQQDLIFENIFFQAQITTLISAVTPINNFKFINSVLDNSKIMLRNINTQGATYDKTHILLSGTTFRGSGNQTLVESQTGRTATLKVLGSIVEDNSYTPSVIGNVGVVSNDIGL